MVLKKTIVVFLLTAMAQQKVFSQNPAAKVKLEFTSAEKNRVAVDSVYNYQVGVKSNTANAIHISIANLPFWLNFDAEKNTFSGKPLKAGQYPIDIIASDADTTIHQQFMLTVYNRATKNILALGNSITNGTNKYNSYRRVLWQLLHKGNYNFDFIGSWNKHHGGGNVPNPDFDMDHDGHSGWKASDILHPPDWDKERGSLYEWIRSYSPDIVLIELGTNEVFQCITAQEAMHSIHAIIEVLRGKNPAVKIFLAQIPPLGAQWATQKLCNNTEYAQAIINFNKAIVQFAAKENTRTSPVIPVDQFSGVNTATDMYDDIHPNDKGEREMAKRWFMAIKKYLKTI
jgi:acyl-CoA thioesterase-1